MLIVQFLIKIIKNYPELELIKILNDIIKFKVIKSKVLKASPRLVLAGKVCAPINSLIILVYQMATITLLNMISILLEIGSVAII